MGKWGYSEALQALSAIYVLSASAFAFALALQAGQPWALGVKSMAEAFGPPVSQAMLDLDDTVLTPLSRYAGQKFHAAGDAVASLWLNEKKAAAAQGVAHRVHRIVPPAQGRSAAPPGLAAKPPVTAPAVPEAKKAPAMELAQTEAETPELMPAPDSAPPSAAETGRVLAHLKTSLSRELYENFGLFLYVSKAERGPWHQRMFVFAKQNNGDLKLSYTFPVSTGREALVASPSGKMLQTHTPPGIYQLDPDRLYKRYTSHQWQHKMPYAMFFNWERNGLQTGLAIHSAVGEDIGDLGKRASAGCVRLAPQNAELLFQVIKKEYRGLTPRFAYDRRTATMSNEGLLMHDKAGNIQYQDGYRVLVIIENNGGDDVIAALF